MANRTGDARGPGMPGSGGWVKVNDPAPETTRILGPAGDVDFDFDDVQPIRGVYVEPDDNLQINIVSNVISTVLVNYRVLTPKEGVKEGTFALANAGGRVNQLFSLPLPEGFLLSVVAIPNAGLFTSAYIFVSIALRFGAQSLANVVDILAQGYTFQAAPIAFPQGQISRLQDGMGALVSRTGTTPAAGAEISEVVPTSARWQLLSLQATLTTAIAVASRQVEINLDDGALIFYSTPQGTIQTASLAVTYTFAPTGAAPAALGNPYVIHYDNTQFLGGLFRIRTETEGIQGADQWTAPQYIVREWQDTL